MGILIEESLGGHDETGRTVPACGSALLDEGLLDGVRRVFLQQALDGQDALACHRYRQGHAGQRRLAVHDDRTGPAGAVVTGDLCPGQAEFIPQDIRQRHLIFNTQDIVIPAVDVQGQDLVFVSRHLRPPAFDP